MAPYHRRPYWLLYPGWIASGVLAIFIAVGVYWVLARLIVTIVGDRIVVGGQSAITEDFVLPYVLWPVLGLANGLFQYLMLRCYLPRMSWWIMATALGWSLGLFGARYLEYAVLPAASGQSLWFAAVRVALTGGAIGLAQWFMLRERVHHAAWWILANIAGWGLSAACTRSLDLWVLALPAVGTVAALWLLLQPVAPNEEIDC